MEGGDEGEMMAKDTKKKRKAIKKQGEGMSEVKTGVSEGGNEG